MTERFANAAQTVLTSTVNAVTTTLAVADAARFPSTSGGGQFRILIGNELLLVTDHTANVLTVTRGIESTVAAGHAASSTVTAILTVGGLEQALAEVSASAVADDIGKSGPINIDRVLGFKGVQFETGDTLGVGEVWKKRGSKLRAAKPVPPGWFDVRDYGAVGDGTTDDTAAINAAIAAAGALNAGIVYCPRGRYKITSQLTTLPSGVHLQGERNWVWAPFQFGTTFETYVADTVLYMGENNDANVSTYSRISNILFQNCLPGNDAYFSQRLYTVTAASNTTPIAITTSTAHGLTTGHTVQIDGIEGNLAANGKFLVVVTGANTFTLTGSVGNGAWTSGGTVFAQEQFNVLAGACLENRGGTHFEIDHCVFIAYALGIVLDGAETGLIDRCQHIGVIDGRGYQSVGRYGRNVWLVDGSQRGRGWTLGNCVNNHVLRDCVYGAAEICVYINGGTSILLTDCNFEGGITGIALSGPNQVSIKRCAMEGYASEFIRIGPGNALNVTLEHNSADGSCAGIRAEAGVSFLNMSQNILGVDQQRSVVAASNTTPIQLRFASPHKATTGDTMIVDLVLGNTAANGTWTITVLGPHDITLDGSVGNGAWTSGGQATNPISASIVGAGFISDLSGSNNWNQHLGHPFVDAQLAGAGITCNADGQGTTVGIGVNNGRPARAMIDARVLDNTKPLMRVTGSYVRFQHDSKSEQHHQVKYGSNSALTGTTRGGVTGTSESALLLGAGSDADLAAYEFPDQTLAVVAFTVVQWYDTDPTKRGIWRCSQTVYKYGGAITFVGSLNDDVTADVTDGGFTHPELVDDGAGNVVVRVHAHTTTDSHVQVVPSVIAAGR